MSNLQLQSPILPYMLDLFWGTMILDFDNCSDHQPDDEVKHLAHSIGMLVFSIYMCSWNSMWSSCKLQLAERHNQLLAFAPMQIYKSLLMKVVQEMGKNLSTSSDLTCMKFNQQNPGSWIRSMGDNYLHQGQWELAHCLAWKNWPMRPIQNNSDKWKKIYASVMTIDFSQHIENNCTCKDKCGSIFEKFK